MQHLLSWVNHSCNPNAVIIVGGVGGSNNNVSVLKAAQNIVPWEEITISYLGKYHNNTEEMEQEIDSQYLQMATSVCGSWHWETHFLNLSLIKDSLVFFHSMLLALGGHDLVDGNRDGVTLEELYVEIAKVADGIERAFKFALSLELRLNLAHWQFDYVIGLAWVLVGLGDVKLMKYRSKWIEKVEKNAKQFTNDGMTKVIIALRMLGRGKLKIQMTSRLVAVASTAEVRMQRRTANEGRLAR